MQQPTFKAMPGSEPVRITSSVPATIAIPSPLYGVLPGRRAAQFYAMSHVDGHALMVLVHADAKGELGAAYFELTAAMARRIAEQMLNLAGHLEKQETDCFATPASDGGAA